MRLVHASRAAVGLLGIVGALVMWIVIAGQRDEPVTPDLVPSDPPGWTTTDTLAEYPVGLPSEATTCPGTAHALHDDSRTRVALLAVFSCPTPLAAQHIAAAYRQDQPGAASSIRPLLGADVDGGYAIATSSGVAVDRVWAQGVLVMRARALCSDDALQACLTVQNQLSQVLSESAPSQPLDHGYRAGDAFGALLVALLGLPLTAGLLLVVGPAIWRFAWSLPSRAPASWLISVDRQARSLRRRSYGTTVIGVTALLLGLWAASSFIETDILRIRIAAGVVCVLCAAGYILARRRLRPTSLRPIRRDRHTRSGALALGAVLRGSARGGVLVLAVFLTVVCWMFVVGGSSSYRAQDAVSFLNSMPGIGPLLGQASGAAALTSDHFSSVIWLVVATGIFLTWLDRAGVRATASRGELPSATWPRSVLYLRNFRDDLMRVPASRPSRYGVLARLSPARRYGINDVILRHAESIGPVMGAADPSRPTWLPDGAFTAARYTGDDWRDRIEAMADAAQVVVVHATAVEMTDGLRHELEYLCHRVSHTRVLLVAGTGAGARVATLRRRWSAFCDVVEGLGVFNGQQLRHVGANGTALLLTWDPYRKRWMGWTASRRTEWAYAAAFAEAARMYGPSWSSEAIASSAQLRTSLRTELDAVPRAPAAGRRSGRPSKAS